MLGFCELYSRIMILNICYTTDFFSFKSCWLLKIFSLSAVFLYLNGGKTNPYLYSRALVEILHRLRNIELYTKHVHYFCVFFSVKKEIISFQVKHVCTGRWHSVLQEALPGDSGCQEHTDSRLIAEQPRESVCQWSL